jgi:hypothetical protein
MYFRNFDCEGESQVVIWTARPTELPDIEIVANTATASVIVLSIIAVVRSAADLGFRRSAQQNPAISEHFPSQRGSACCLKETQLRRARLIPAGGLL